MAKRRLRGIVYEVSDSAEPYSIMIKTEDGLDLYLEPSTEETEKDFIDDYEKAKKELLNKEIEVVVNEKMEFISIRNLSDENLDSSNSDAESFLSQETSFESSEADENIVELSTYKFEDSASDTAAERETDSKSEASNDDLSDDDTDSKSHQSQSIRKARRARKSLLSRSAVREKKEKKDSKFLERETTPLEKEIRKFSITVAKDIFVNLSKKEYDFDEMSWVEIRNRIGRKVVTLAKEIENYIMYTYEKSFSHEEKD